MNCNMNYKMSCSNYNILSEFLDKTTYEEYCQIISCLKSDIRADVLTNLYQWLDFCEECYHIWFYNEDEQYFSFDELFLIVKWKCDYQKYAVQE